MEEQRTLEAIERLKEQTQRLELLSEQVDSKIAQADGSYIQQLSGLEHQLQLKDEHVHQLSRDLAQLRHWQQLIADKDSTDDDEDNLLSDKEERIEELEEALRESVRITADREMALHAETQLRMQISEKVHFTNNLLNYNESLIIDFFLIINFQFIFQKLFISK